MPLQVKGIFDKHSLVLANLVAAALGMVSGLIITRGLGPAGRGELTAVVPIAVLLSSVSLLGLVDYVIWYSARNGAFPGWAAIRKAQKYGLIIGAGALAVLLAPTVIRHESTLGLAILAIAFLPALQAALICQGYLQGSGKFKRLALTRVMPQIIVLAAALVMLHVSHFSVLLVGLIQLGSISLTVLIVRVGASNNSAEAQNDRGKVFDIALPAWLAGLPALALQRVDLLLVTALVSHADQIGFYSVALTLSALPQMVAQSLGLIIRTSSIHAVSKRPLFDFKFDALAVCGSCVALLMGAPFLIPWLLGDAFDSAILPAVLLLVAAIPLGLSTLIAEEMLGFGKFKEVRGAWFAGAVATTVLVTVLVLAIGATGAAIGCIVGYSVSLTIMLARRRDSYWNGPRGS